MTGLIILVVVILIISFLTSLAETSIYSTNLSRAIMYKEQKVSGSEALLRIKENPSTAITTLVLINNINNIVGSIFVGSVATKVFGDSLLGLVSACITILIIIFGEIFPKTIGENHADTISIKVAPILYFVSKILRPITYVFENLTRRYLKKRKTVSEEELRLLSQIGALEGSIEQDEREIIHRVFTMNDKSAKDIMTPRTVVEYINEEKKLGDLDKGIFHRAYSRLPIVKDDDIDHIVGILQTKNALLALAEDSHDKLVKDLGDQAFFVNESTKVDALLTIFKNHHIHMAIVRDEFGGTAGIVTLEDVLEVLVGEIVDETDDVEDLRAYAIENKRK